MICLASCQLLVVFGVVASGVFRTDEFWLLNIDLLRALLTHLNTLRSLSLQRKGSRISRWPILLHI